jgi:hypothetical protein
MQRNIEYDHCHSDISEDEHEDEQVQTISYDVQDVNTLHNIITQMGDHIQKQQNENSMLHAHIEKESKYTQMYRIMCKLQDEKIDSLEAEYKRLFTTNQELNDTVKNLVKICQSLYDENEKLKLSQNGFKNGKN